jgi:hypothetical protein
MLRESDGRLRGQTGSVPLREGSAHIEPQGRDRRRTVSKATANGHNPRRMNPQSTVTDLRDVYSTGNDYVLIDTKGGRALSVPPVPLVNDLKKQGADYPKKESFDSNVGGGEREGPVSPIAARRVPRTSSVTDCSGLRSARSEVTGDSPLGRQTAMAQALAAVQASRAKGAGEMNGRQRELGRDEHNGTVNDLQRYGAMEGDDEGSESAEESDVPVRRRTKVIF